MSDQPTSAGSDVVQAVEEVLPTAEKDAFRFAIELADWVKDHVAAHPVRRAGLPPAAASSTPGAAAASSGTSS